MFQTYIGVKNVLARPMTRGDYNAYRGWQTPENELAEDQGYLVEYLDGGKPNDPRHAGYISWSPKSVFEKSNVLIGDTTGLPAFVVRLLGERAELLDRLTKLGKAIDLQHALRLDPSMLTEEERIACLGAVKIDDFHLELMEAQKTTMMNLLGILDRRLTLIDLGTTVVCEAVVKLPLANGSRFDLIGLALADQDWDGGHFTGIVDDLIVDDAKITDEHGNELEFDERQVSVEKLVRGFSISGGINEDLFDIGIQSETGRAHVTSSFETPYQLHLTVKLGTRNRLPEPALRQ